MLGNSSFGLYLQNVHVTMVNGECKNAHPYFCIDVLFMVSLCKCTIPGLLVSCYTLVIACGVFRISLRIMAWRCDEFVKTLGTLSALYEVTLFYTTLSVRPFAIHCVSSFMKLPSFTPRSKCG